MKSQRNNTLELNEPTTKESKLIDLPFEKVGTLKCNKVLKRYKHQIFKSQRTKGQIPSENLKLLPASECSGAHARQGLYIWPLFPSHISSLCASWLLPETSFLKNFDGTCSAPAGPNKEIRTFKPIYRICMTKMDIDFQSFQLLKHRI